MRRIFILLAVCLLNIVKIYAKFPNSDSTQYEYLLGFDFVKINEFGDTLYYYFKEYPPQKDVLIGEMANEVSPFKTDSLVIPEIVSYNGVEYNVTGMVDCALYHSPTHVKTITLPKTFVDFVDEDGAYLLGLAYSSFQCIYCHEDNPKYTGIDGILYSKDKKTLVAYPPQRKDSSVIVPEGVEHLGKNAFCCSPIVKKIKLPNTLKTIGERALFNMKSLEELVLQDSVQTIKRGSFLRTPITKLIMGSQIKEVSYSFLSRGLLNKVNDSITVICHTLIPPIVNFENTAFTTLLDNSAIHLYVPRKSLNLYQQAEGWKDCASILPIEPPIVSGVNEAEVSWVQNFSATGYVWTLYLDEAQTQPYLQLTFDKDGHLTNIDLNRPNAPQLSAEEGDKQEDKSYAEYYSFTITGLDANTKYYYTRQTLAGERVIDEETGSFETLPDGAPTGINPLLFEPSPQKTFENGMLRIRKNGNTYNVNGTKVE